MLDTPIEDLINKNRTPRIGIQWEISHFMSNEGMCLQVWQYVNGAGDGGFSCLVSDYKSAVAKQVGVGAVALHMNNFIYEYLRKNNIK